MEKEGGAGGKEQKKAFNHDQLITGSFPTIFQHRTHCAGHTVQKQAHRESQSGYSVTWTYGEQTSEIPASLSFPLQVHSRKDMVQGLSEMCSSLQRIHANSYTRISFLGTTLMGELEWRNCASGYVSELQIEKKPPHPQFRSHFAL